MNIWQHLGIGPTNDIPTIKKAYAGRLKQHHPEDDPEGYQMLREAYDAAIKQAKGLEKQWEIKSIQGEEIHSAQDQVNPKPFPKMNSSVQTALLLQSQPSIHEQLNQFIEQADALYQDFRSRIDTARWVELLNTDVIWNLRHKQMVGQRLYRFFQEHRMLPKSVWLLLESSFHWKAELEDPEPDEFIRYYLRQLDGPDLKFSFLNPHLDIEVIDHFLSSRETACHALQENDLNSANHLINEALDIFGEDPDLLRLQGELYVRKGELNEALKIFNHFILLQPGEIDGFVYRARILYQLGRFPEAILDCETAYGLAPNHMGIQFLLGKCHLAAGDNEKAIAIFEQLHASHPHNLQFTGILTELHGKQRKPKTPQPHPVDVMNLKESVMSRLTLSPSRRYRIGFRRKLVIFFLSALLLCSFVFSDQLIGDPYQHPIIVSTPGEELAKQDSQGDFVQMTLTNPHFTYLYQFGDEVLDFSRVASRIEQYTNSQMKRVAVGSLEGYSVWFTLSHSEEYKLAGGEATIRGKIKFVNAGSDIGKLNRKRLILIDTFQLPHSSSYKILAIFRFLILAFFAWSLFRFFKKHLT